MEEYNLIQSGIEYFSNLDANQIVWGVTGILSVATVGFVGMVAHLYYVGWKEKRNKCLESGGLEKEIRRTGNEKND